jgi:tetratricopeptide (TPR) repeat protein
MGALYLARDPQLDRLVAIKLLKEDLQDDSELRERFLREARSVARLRHSNIVIVHDVGEDQGRSFMAMEYIAGETLAHVLRRTPTPPLTTRLAMVEDLCAGLAHAHSAGIIHRDIKPANIMIDADGVLKILDFGIARTGGSGMTQEGRIMGSVNYMSPEQVMGRGVDHRTDIFAAGTVLYEVITLAQAFPGGVDTGVLHRILHEGPVPLEQWTPTIDAELTAIVHRAMARDPGQRYDDAGVMRGDLMRVRRRLANESPDSVFAPTLVLPSATSAPTMAPGTQEPDGDQQATGHMRLSEEAFALGEYETALAHADRAASLAPGSREATILRDKVRAAIEAKATATREREERIVSSLERARSSIDRGGYETALRAVYEVLALDPDRADARALEQRAQAQIQARREGMDDRPSGVSHPTTAPGPVETTRRPSSPLHLFAIVGGIAAVATAAVVVAFVWNSRGPASSGVQQKQAPAPVAPAPAPAAPAPEQSGGAISVPNSVPIAPAPSPARGPAPSPRHSDSVVTTQPVTTPAPPAATPPPPSTQTAAPATAPDRTPPTAAASPPAVVDAPLPPVLAAARAAQLLELGSQSEKAEDWPAALGYYERARKMDPSLSPLASAGVTRVQTQMLADGTDAFKRAQQFVESCERCDHLVRARGSEPPRYESGQAHRR